MIRKIGAIFIILILVVGGLAWYFLASGAESPYWETQWNTDSTDDNGLWMTEIIIGFKDGTSKSYKQMLDSPTMTITHDGEEVEYCTFRLGAVATGDYDECELDLTDMILVEEVRRWYDENGDILIPIESAVVRNEKTDLCPDHIFIDVTNADNPDISWIPCMSSVIDLDDLHREYPSDWQSGQYAVQFNCTGGCQYRGTDLSHTNNGDWEDMAIPQAVGAWIDVTQISVTITFSTDLEFSGRH